MIQRVFYPIGQGAFYSERHENFNIVYDCGNLKDKKIADKVVKQSFDKNEIVDVLFISHFDYDHISKITTLKDHVKKINTVILPLLHDNEKMLLQNVYRMLNFNYLTLISSPEQYFEKDTKIIRVRHSEEGENVEDNNIEPQDIENINDEIQSGSILTSNRLKDWIFIPHNDKYRKRHSDLISGLKSNGFNEKKLKNNSEYTIKKIYQDTNLSKKQGGRKFRQIYNKLDGKINQNSMLLYSGPSNTNNKKDKICFRENVNNTSHIYYDFCFHSNKVACIYTGDANLNKTSINKIYNTYWNNVGTIQVPHHGDHKCFNRQELKGKGFNCPISFGSNNSFGHPSNKIIGEILSKHSSPILVTEKLDKMFIEIIIN